MLAKIQNSTPKCPQQNSTNSFFLNIPPHENGRIGWLVHEQSHRHSNILNLDTNLFLWILSSGPSLYLFFPMCKTKSFTFFPIFSHSVLHHCICSILVPMPTLFSKRSAHGNHPNCLRSLGPQPRPRMTLGQGHRENWVNQCALLLEKSVFMFMSYREDVSC